MNCLTSLFNYQQKAVDKLLPSRVGALFMEMGTGKTRTAIEFVRLRQSRIKRVLWFCPVTLKETIRQEILKHTDARPGDICVFSEKISQKILPQAFWYISGIETMSSSMRAILTVNKMVDYETFIIVDESSYIKGHAAKRTAWITRLSYPARYRMILTGTPISQGVVDLYAQMRFLSPDILGYRSFYSFAKNHLEYSDKYKGMIRRSLNVEYLAEKINPYVYQVTKAECIDLPGKFYEERHFDLTEKQVEAYQQAKEEILLPKNGEVDSYDIFRLFTALQEITSGFWNRNGILIEYPHERIELTICTILEIPEDKKVIIWCKFTKSLKDLRSALGHQFGDGSVAVLYGELSEKERDSEIHRFRSDARFLVATESIGGHGFTLNEANYVIFYENGFKYSERIQAEDRCHRIGQTMPVTYIDIVSAETIDGRILRCLAKKEDVVRAFKKRVDQVKDSREKINELVSEL